MRALVSSLSLVMLILCPNTRADDPFFWEIPLQIASVSTPAKKTSLLFGTGVRMGIWLTESPGWKLGTDAKIAVLFGGNDGTPEVSSYLYRLDLEPRLLFGYHFINQNFAFIPYGYLSATGRAIFSYTVAYDETRTSSRPDLLGGAGLGSFICFSNVYFRIDSGVAVGFEGYMFQTTLSLGMNLLSPSL